MMNYRSTHARVGSDSRLRAPLHLDEFRRTALGQIIATHRYQRRISREAFAELLGITLDQLDRLEAGEVDGLSVPAAWTIADILGVDLAELLHETRWRVQELAAERWSTEATTRRIAS